MTPPPDDQGLSSTAKGYRAAAPYISAVWRLLGATLVSGAGGYAIDSHFHTSPWFLLVFLLSGMSVGFYAFFKTINDLGKQKRP